MVLSKLNYPDQVSMIAATGFSQVTMNVQMRAYRYSSCLIRKEINVTDLINVPRNPDIKLSSVNENTCALLMLKNAVFVTK